jgi:hypothetical protein
MPVFMSCVCVCVCERESVCMGYVNDDIHLRANIHIHILSQMYLGQTLVPISSDSTAHHRAEGSRQVETIAHHTESPDRTPVFVKHVHHMLATLGNIIRVIIARHVGVLRANPRATLAAGGIQEESKHVDGNANTLCMYMCMNV